MHMKIFNPTAKLVANLIVLIAAVAIFEPKTMALLFAVVLLFGLGTQSFTRKNLVAVIPLASFAIGMLWMNGAFARIENPTIAYTIGSLDFTKEGLTIGVTLFFRILIIGVSSILFTSNTDPDKLVLSLIQQCRLHPGVAYGILTAFRFLPSMEEDLALINAAHRIRRSKEKKWYKKKNPWYKNAIPLLATNVRRAERVAIAMEARGFESKEKRTYYRSVNWYFRDTVFIVFTIMLVGAVIGFSVKAGWFLGFKHWQGF